MTLNDVMLEINMLKQTAEFNHKTVSILVQEVANDLPHLHRIAVTLLDITEQLQARVNRLENLNRLKVVNHG